jgi:hypothetical protein
MYSESKKLSGASSKSIVASSRSLYPGQLVLDRMGFGSSTIANTLKAQGLIILANYIFTCLSLATQNPSQESITILDRNNVIVVDSKKTKPKEEDAFVASSSAAQDSERKLDSSNVKSNIYFHSGISSFKKF